MVTLLSRLMKIDELPEERQRIVYGMLCGGVGIFLNIILFIIKLLAGLLSGAVSIMADAFNNLSDAGSSLVTLLGFKLASQKADRQHPYGHGRIEYISGLIVAGLILVMGFELIRESIGKIIHPEDVLVSPVIIAILIVSILVKCYMAFYNFRVGNKIDSSPVKATAIDSLSDCIATGAVLGCTILGHFFGYRLDGWAGVVVSLFIFYAGYSAAKESLEPLLGTPPDPEFLQELEEIVMSYDENIEGMHDLMVHDYGPGRLIISLHAEVPDDANILEMHDIIDNLEKKLETDLGCVATIHMDPIATKDPIVLIIRGKIEAMAKRIHPHASIHDFRVVLGKTHTNLLFDLALPFECPLTDLEAENKIQQMIWAEISKRYFVVVNIDRENYITHP